MAYLEMNMWVSSSMYAYKCPYEMTPIGVCVHNTWNDASAEDEAQNMRKPSNKKKISFHDVVDDVKVVHCIPHSRNAFHAGDGKNGKGNRYYIGVEICYSKSGGARFDQAEINAAKYIADILKKRGWGISRVKRHYDFSGKDCPHRTMDKGWQRFLNMIQAELDGDSVEAVADKLVVDECWGRATTSRTQEVLGTPVDGIVSRQPKSNKKYLPNCMTSSWKFVTVYRGGSAMIKSMQELVGAKPDGYFGPGSAYKTQAFLKEKGFYKGKLDKVFGPLSVAGWQMYINSRL